MRAQSGTTGYLQTCPYCGAPIGDPRYTNCPNCGGLLSGASTRMQRPAHSADWSNAQTDPVAPVLPGAARPVPRNPQPRPRRREGHGWLGCVVPVMVALLLLAAASAFAIYYVINTILTSGS